METVLWLLAVQGLLGGFDVLYHHEITERLPWRRTQGRELRLHGIRNFFYVWLFFAIAWSEWHGLFAGVLGVVALLEIFITLADFIEEDRSRKLPASERITHTLLALNYGAVLAAMTPVWLGWLNQPSAIVAIQYGWLSWLISLYGVAVLVWGLRDYLRGQRHSLHRGIQTSAPENLAKPCSRILITGGTGFLGAPLCRHLIRSGHNVTVLTRNPAHAATALPTPVTFISSLAQMDDGIRFDAVINLAGEPVSQRWTPPRQQEMRRSRIDTTRALVDWMAKQPQKPHCFISASAIGIYGVSETGEFIEDSPRSKEDAGLFARQLCEDWEEEARRAEGAGIRTCLIRIGVALETEGGALAQMLPAFDLGIGGRMGHGRQWFSWVHRVDVLRLILHCINQADMHGPYNASAPHPLTNAEFSKALGKAMHRPALLPLPALPIRLLFGNMGDTLLLKGQKVLPERTLASGFTFRYSHVQDALQDIFAP